jgi:hypothetical protein
LVISLRKWWIRLKFAVLFLVLTSLLYCLFSAVLPRLPGDARYRQPEGSAVKAFLQEKAYSGTNGSPIERLFFFYRYGE